ncbi:MAG TPA: tRNA pseudouridine(38-40) synthase TruA [Acidimicrobiia bacterium]|jgi:tRNA pseudouridine38-40 synthase
MAIVRVDLSYDGSGFRGFARQGGQRTVQGELETALATVLGEKVTTVGAGRTDAGVHARHQVASFEYGGELDPAQALRRLNGLLGPEIVVVALAEVPAGFSARFSAKWRRYRYFLDPSSRPDPLTRGWVWHFGRPLDLEAMARAAAGFVGEHDFTSFCRSAPGRGNIRTVLSAGWMEEGKVLAFDVKAEAFCHQMVRSMVGFCVAAGTGKIDPDRLEAVLTARDRNAAPEIAPPHGLTLWDVGY